MNEFAAIRTIGTTAISPHPDPVPLRAFLRFHTAERHARLDARFADLAGPPTVESYRRLEEADVLGSQGGKISARFPRSAFHCGGSSPDGLDMPGANEPARKNWAMAAALAMFALFERCLDQVAAHEGGKEPSL